MPGFTLKALILHFWEGTSLSQEQIVFILPAQTAKTTTNNLLNDLHADNGYQTVTNRVGGNVFQRLQARSQETRGRTSKD